MSLSSLVSTLASEVMPATLQAMSLQEEKRAAVRLGGPRTSTAQCQVLPEVSRACLRPAAAVYRSLIFVGEP